MIQILLPNGETIQVEWMAVAQLDGVLRFNTIGVEPLELIRIFSNPENCSPLSRVFDGTTTDVYTDYTVFRGINVNYDNTAMISLSKF